MTRKYGWNPDRPDKRDLKFADLARPGLGPLPPSVDLRGPFMPDVYDQGQVGSCTGNAVAAALQYERRRQNLFDWVPSRLFAYYNGRSLEGQTGTDSGAMLRDVIKGVATQGDCPESCWPYDPSQVTTAPTPADYAVAIKYRAVQYYAVAQTSNDARACLAAGFPFVFGFSVYPQFESAPCAQTGVVELPGLFAGRVIGGHAVVACGYDDSAERFTCRNSWGADWGQSGYFTLPYDYVLDPDLASDLWTIRLVSA